mgnify:CR=1 FL=1
MDLYLKITITLLIIGFAILLILVPFMLAESDFAEILAILVTILIGGGLAMALLSGVFEVLKLLWIS